LQIDPVERPLQRVAGDVDEITGCVGASQKDAALRDTVPLQDCDSMKQERVAIHELPAILRDRASPDRS